MFSILFTTQLGLSTNLYITPPGKDFYLSRIKFAWKLLHWREGCCFQIFLFFCLLFLSEKAKMWQKIEGLRKIHRDQRNVFCDRIRENKHFENCALLVASQKMMINNYLWFFFFEALTLILGNNSRLQFSRFFFKFNSRVNGPASCFQKLPQALELPAKSFRRFRPFFSRLFCRCIRQIPDDSGIRFFFVKFHATIFQIYFLHF